MKITNPEDMRKISVDGQMEYEKSVMEGPLFKSIMAEMEQAALEGYSGFNQTITDSADLRDYYVIQKAFTDAGYKCEIEIERRKGLMNIPYVIRKFFVSWDNDKK
ncbi:hypothetical protein NCCP2716_23230 [Sporosarcina sp. NCCP-2716]|uniref:hypothetical protein n=1 Tax=Sporosarcina sp. NCCP-2716 TaxID=2943679 RepID=UPI00203E210A|nr:hypothetical protein [Sporosarcina sp. NCCP-2716]GKV69825.1 hypothetical protein NCCP2716_23230 [Sporosarcina sp. NCCP-2716]